MRRWFKQFFCSHDWRDDGHQDFCNLFQIFHDNGVRLRKTYWRCENCGKRQVTETMMSPT